MIERYTPPDIACLWTDEAKMQRWLEIEILAVEARYLLGEIPEKDYKTIKRKAKFSIRRILEIEKEVKHDVIAFLTTVAENVGASSRYIHQGLTSSDILDTGLSLQMRDAGKIIINDINSLLKVIAKKAKKYKYTLQIGRTHGIHAEPTTFGLKLAFFYEEMKRNKERIQRSIKNISVGKLSGAVGTFEHLSPKVEAHVCKKLGLKPEGISTQIISRDRHAEYLTTLSIAASSLERFSVECRHLQRTEILEVEEYFERGQKGSSAMPHKRNPITFERITGLSRVIRSNVIAALENVALWHERDISHSSVERIIIPDSIIALCYILRKTTNALEKLIVYPENMLKNFDASFGLISSQSILLAIIQKGISREDAYQLVQKNAMKSWETKTPLQEVISKDQKVASILSSSELEKLFSKDLLQKKIKKNVDFIFKRLNI